MWLRPYKRKEERNEDVTTRAMIEQCKKDWITEDRNRIRNRERCTLTWAAVGVTLMVASWSRMYEGEKPSLPLAWMSFTCGERDNGARQLDMMSYYEAVLGVGLSSVVGIILNRVGWVVRGEKGASSSLGFTTLNKDNQQ